MSRTVTIIMLVVLFLMAPYAKYAVGEDFPPPIVEERDNVLIIKEDLGGNMTDYMVRYAKMRRDQTSLAIDGHCDSSCTLFFGYIQPSKVCITENAQFGFHRASRPEGTIVMMMNYPATIIMWLLAEGLTEDIKFLPVEIMHLLFNECPAELIHPKPPGEKVD